MEKCKYCGRDTSQENGVCENCRALSDFIQRDKLEDSPLGFGTEETAMYRLPALLCCFPFFFWIPYLLYRRTSRYVRFYANQGLIMSALTVVCLIAAGIGMLILHFAAGGGVRTFAYLLLIGASCVWGFYLVWGMVSAVFGSGSVLPLLGRLRILPGGEKK